MASNVDCNDSNTSAGSGGAFVCEDRHNSALPAPAEQQKSVIKSPHTIIKICHNFFHDDNFTKIYIVDFSKI